MEMIYLVTSGDYSDYRVCGIYSDIELAQKFIASFTPSYDDFRIETQVLNPFSKELNDDYKPYFIRMTKEGNCTEINIKDSSYGFEDGNIDIGFDINKSMYISIFAKNETHAIKIANEKRAELIANNKWKS